MFWLGGQVKIGKWSIFLCGQVDLGSVVKKLGGEKVGGEPVSGEKVGGEKSQWRNNQQVLLTF